MNAGVKNEAIRCLHATLATFERQLRYANPGIAIDLTVVSPRDKSAAESAARRRAASVRARAAAARVRLSGEHGEPSGCAQRGQGDVRSLREHALKVGARGTSTRLRQSSIDVEIVLRGALA